MSKSSNRFLLLLLVALLAACQSGPQTAPRPEPVVGPEPVAAPAPEAEPAPADETAAPATETEPEPVDFNQQFYEEAIGSLKSGKAELALQLLLQVSSDAPDKPYVFTNLGLAYFGLEKFDLAEKAFGQALERDAEDAVAHNHLGVLLRYKGQFEAARQHYQQAIDNDSDYAQAWLNLGILFDMYLQDLQMALRHYQKYQSLISEEDSRVGGWIIDIERRLKSSKTGSQG